MNPQSSSRPLPGTPDGTDPAGADSDWASPGETPQDAPPPAASPLGDSSRVMLQQIIDVGPRLVGARYGALGIFNDSGSDIVQFITSGIEESVREAIGPFPA